MQSAPSGAVARDDGARRRRADATARALAGAWRRGRATARCVLAATARRQVAAPEAVFHEAHAPPDRLSLLPDSIS